MKQVLQQLIEHKALSKDTAKQVLLNIGRNQYNPSQMAAFMTVYLMRNITVQELEGFREAMLELCLVPELGTDQVIDLCGTGGDGKDTFNISTLASFVVAGAGYKVAKHGNTGVSSICGSSNVMAHLGFTFTNDSATLRQKLEETNICFLHAPLFHPAMKEVAPIRKDLGVKTFFNMLGPMINPAKPKFQMVGVFSLELLRLYTYLYQQTGKRFVLLHALDGYDEVSLTGAFKMVTPQGEQILQPSDLGLPTYQESDLSGGSTIEASAAIFMNVLEGRGTPAQQDAVVVNAGLGIYCSDERLTLQESLQKARQSLNNGLALKTFHALLA
ncbi:anthranilate phosphoribosyltransferase [Rufibacter glacialis]|uniref:Anthranilate phosphoribosyltransferase n=1 Tax=Rufibacter glacialis TaxID=1259555 RepID=A0A5M8QGW2_9BACT|nr:anthranilate phosphoribosyltransferase [Rufibacter glacialis]KAA6434458.1 anthranilate phosphoribosyltransferase [Rufibacter glacialis]GGK69812.1 anthranilate phosphoribosyltransferase [Rufibacter glacialis]